MMETEVTFTPQVLGETEKALNAILDRQLATTGLTEHQWITLRLAVAGGAAVQREQLGGRLAGALKRGTAEAHARVNDLLSAGLLAAGADGGVTVTEAGRELHGRILSDVTQITERLWGDLPGGDLATTGRTLATILERANAHFAGGLGSGATI
jgi:hypothetical protein